MTLTRPRAGTGTRTRDPVFTRHVLYQLSYSGVRISLGAWAGVGARARVTSAAAPGTSQRWITTLSTGVPASVA
jgi:hypothetical protein